MAGNLFLFTIMGKSVGVIHPPAATVYSPWVVPGLYAKDGALYQKNEQRDAAQAKADAEVDLATAQETRAAGAAAANRWNSAALAGARRRAGGSSYRNRGTMLSSAPSLLDKANIDDVAAARRKKAKAATDLAYADKKVDFSWGGSRLGAPIQIW
jgi:hypothetical protein